MWGTTVRNRDSRLERVTRRRAPGRVVKPSQVFSAVVMLVALLAGWFAPPQQSFEQRWVAMPAAMSWAQRGQCDIACTIASITVRWTPPKFSTRLHPGGSCAPQNFSDALAVMALLVYSA